MSRSAYQPPYLKFEFVALLIYRFIRLRRIVVLVDDCESEGVAEVLDPLLAGADARQNLEKNRVFF